MSKEIYRVKFSKYINEQDIPCYTMYTLGRTGLVDGETLTPLKITLRGGKITVNFAELGIKHVFAYTDDVELFYKDKTKEDAEETTDRTE